MSKLQKTKSGVASLYVVVFATILFGVITLSFTRIILSESTQSSNDDLSRSAYDSALAGVEDAKIAVNDYYQCLSNTTNAAACASKNVFSDPASASCENGFPLARVRYGITTGEVFLQELNTSAAHNDATAADQAYTCVIITDITPDYRGTLTSDTRTRVIPIGINSLSGGQSVIGNVAKVRFSWYSELNQGKNTTFRFSPAGTFAAPSEATVPPTLQLTFIRTSSSIKISDLYYNSDNNTVPYENNSANIINSTMLFLPSANGNTITTVASNDLGQLAGNTTYLGGSTYSHHTYPVECTTGREFACVVELDVAGLVHSGDNAFLVASLPYGEAFSDFAVTLLDASGNPIDFKGVQVSVDSTGRTGQLFRRVETRLDPADLFFPYPSFALELEGNGEKSLDKRFWVTANCWTEAGYCQNNGEL